MSKSFPLVFLVEETAGVLTERMSSANHEDTVECFKRSGANRCFNGDCMSYGVYAGDCDNRRAKTLHIGDWRDDPRYEESV